MDTLTRAQALQALRGQINEWHKGKSLRSDRAYALANVLSSVLVNKPIDEAAVRAGLCTADVNNAALRDQRYDTLLTLCQLITGSPAQRKIAIAALSVLE